MLKIHLSNHKIMKMVAEHGKHLKDIVRTRLSRPENKFLESYFKSDKQILEVLKCKPSFLLDMNTKINTHFLQTHKAEEIKDAFKRVFNYSQFRKKKPRGYDGFILCNNYGFITCPYCNIHDISTIYLKESQTKVESPPLDHFYSQGQYPLLAISFYNLIPSCWSCNSIYKKEKTTDTITHLHPHLGNFEKDYVFIFSGIRNIDDILGKKSKKFAVKLKNKTKDIRLDGNNDLFQLNIRYTAKNEEAKKALKLAKRSSKAEINAIRCLISSANLPYYDIMNTKYAFEDMHQAPYSKLTRDIFDQYASDELKKLLGI